MAQIGAARRHHAAGVDDANRREVGPERPPPVLVVEQIDQRGAVDVGAQGSHQRGDPNGGGHRLLGAALLGSLLLSPQRLGGQQGCLRPRAIAHDGTRTDDRNRGSDRNQRHSDGYA
ncbi:MAG: hypothetical protein ABUS79_03435 [Pseudomonadota bacterium]